MTEPTKRFLFEKEPMLAKLKEKVSGLVVTNGTLTIVHNGAGLEVVLTPDEMREIGMYLQVIAEQRALATQEIAGRA